MEKQPITGPGYDLGRNEIGRICRLYVVNRVLPLGNMAGFTRCRQLAVLALVHWLGKPIFRLLVPHEAKINRFYRWLQLKRP